MGNQTLTSFSQNPSPNPANPTAQTDDSRQKTQNIALAEPNNDVISMEKTSGNEGLKEKGKRISDCMLEQYFGTAAGVGIGLAVGLQRRNVKPFLIIATCGSLMDYVHGYVGPCSGLIEDYNAAKRSMESEQKSN